MISVIPRGLYTICMGLLEGRSRKKKKRDVNEAVEALKAINVRTEATGADYREQSLSIHGLICAKCAREFEPKDRHLLTVHHKDGNHHNNPKDGSNWENLCVDCHNDEHSRGLLGDYITGEKD